MPAVPQSKNPGTIVGVTTASSVVAPTNSGRVSLLIMNISTVTIYIALAGTAAVTNIPLDPGDTFSLAIDGAEFIYSGPVAAIHNSTGTHNLVVVEV